MTNIILDHLMSNHVILGHMVCPYIILKLPKKSENDLKMYHFFKTFLRNKQILIYDLIKVTPFPHCSMLAVLIFQT